MRDQLRGPQGQVPVPEGHRAAESSVGLSAFGFRTDILRGVRSRASFLLLLVSTCAFAQNTNPVHSWVAAHQREVVRQFAEFLSIPNVASDTSNIRKNAEYISGQLRQR